MTLNHRRTGATHRAAARVALTAAATLAMVIALSAQPSLERPRTSPRALVSQTVGVTDITVNYHRPGVKGREIWGGLTPYDQVWRTGANEVTTITFNDPVTIEGSPLAAGTYGLFTIPRKGNWTVIFSSNTTVWGTDYDSSKDVLKVDVAPKTVEHTEWMGFTFSGLSDTGATLELRWEKLSVPVRIGVRTVDVVLGHARKEFSAGADSGRWQMLRQAAVYAVAQNSDPTEALGWIDRSLAVNRNFQSLCVKSDILARQGDAGGAAAALDSAIAVGTPQEASSYSLTLRRDNRPARAVEVLEKYAAARGESYHVHRALGESYHAAGDKAKALESLGEAADAAPGTPEKDEVNALIQSIKGAE